MSILFAVLFYAATIVLVAGLGLKVAQYVRVPAPLKIPTTPAPLTQGGAAFRVAREVVIFESLFKSNKWLWAMAVMFHFGLVLVLIRHVRYFIEPVPMVITLMQPFGIYGGLLMIIGLFMLLGRRLVLPRIRYITGPSDLLMLVLLIGIGCSGALMVNFVHTDIIGVKAFFLGLMTFNWQKLPADPLLYVHLALVAALMLVFPFSKLLHVPGIFFSPTRNQVDDARERRHLAPWAAKYEANKTMP
ncbi:MAG: respiratory nitrate reductase subunit gamma [Alphaproteobacteria bacterium]|nr:respiratory nitrate reductase subunit gamma [Alphaproteobacteria bacterium]